MCCAEAVNQSAVMLVCKEITIINKQVAQEPGGNSHGVCGNKKMWICGIRM